MKKLIALLFLAVFGFGDAFAQGGGCGVPLSAEARAFLCPAQDADQAAAGVASGVMDCDVPTATALSLAADTLTPAQIIACRPDALRYCPTHKGDSPALRECMALHWSQVSQQCREAFR